MRKTILKMKRLMKSKKAVSPVIAVILLIAIAVAASVTVFAYTQGMIGTLTQANLTMSNAQILTSDTVSVTIQNTGGSSVTVTSVDIINSGSDDVSDVKNAVTGELYGTNGDATNGVSITLSAGGSVTIEIESNHSWSSGDECTIRLWIDGNTASGNGDYSATFEL